MIAKVASTVIGSVLIFSACATSPSPSPSLSSPSSSLAARARAAQPVALTWAWPAGSEAIVEETVLKKGHTVVERYRVRLLPVDGNPALSEVVIDDLHILVVNGKPVDPTTDARAIADAERMGSLLPRMRIDAEGNLVDVVGIDELIDVVAASMPEADRADFVSYMKSPAAQPLMRAVAEKIWNTWVGGLVGLQAKPDEDLVAVTNIAGPDGPLEQETHYILRQAGDHVVVDTRTDTPSPVARAHDATMRASRWWAHSCRSRSPCQRQWRCCPPGRSSAPARCEHQSSWRRPPLW
jgi:hypothetical protein